MNKLKHTPAPWRLERDGWNGQYIFGVDDRVKDKERFIAKVSVFYDGAEENGLLIAAAPEMLNRLLSCYISSKSLLEKEALKDTIEKATGLKIEEII